MRVKYLVDLDFILHGQKNTVRLMGRTVLGDDLPDHRNFLQQPDDQERQEEQDEPGKRQADQDASGVFIDIEEFIQVDLEQRMDDVYAERRVAHAGDPAVAPDFPGEVPEADIDKQRNGERIRPVMFVVEIVEFAILVGQAQGAKHGDEVARECQQR